MFDRYRRLWARLEDGRESMPLAGKGCGCLLFGMLGLGGCPFAGGAMIGDYLGPPEGAAADAHTKNVVILAAFVWFVLCTVAGSWLVTSRQRR